MSDEQIQRRKRVSDGGLGRNDADPTPVRILPDSNKANGSPTSAEEPGEWVIEFGGNPHQDDPTTHLPIDGDANSNRPLRPGTLYTHAATPQPTPAQPQPIAPSQIPPAPPAYANYDYARLSYPAPTPAIAQIPPNTNLIERATQQDDKQPVTVIKKGPSACSIFAATFGVIAIACSLLTFAVIHDGFAGLGNLFGWVPNLFGPPKVSIDTSRPSIIEKISALSRLETVHYSIEKVVPGESVGFLASDRILLVAHGDIVAGVDLSKLKPTDFEVVTATQSVTITLPKAEVFNLNNILDSKKTYVYERTRINPIYTDPNLETQLRDKASEQILQDAIEDGILTKAQANAEDVIKTLATGLGFKEVKFKSSP